MGNKNSPQAKKNKLAQKYMPSFKETAGVAVDRALRFGRSEAGKHGAVLGVHLDDRPNGSMVVCSEYTIELFNPISGDRRLRKTPFGDGIITCVAFQQDSCFDKPVLVYGTRRGFLYFLDLEELSLVKAIEVDVLLSGKKKKKESTVEINLNNYSEDEGGLQMKSMGSGGGGGGMMMEEEQQSSNIQSNTSKVGENAENKFKSGWQQEISGKGISSLNFISSTNILVGADDGRVHEFGLNYGGTTSLYRPPLDGAFDVSPVINAIPVGDSNLIVGHANGDIHVYARHNQNSHSALSIRNGKWQQKLPSLAVYSTDVMINFGRHNGFCTFNSNSHICRVYMFTTRAAKVYDFTSMMNKLKLQNAYVTCGWYDDERQVLFTGHSDGTFLLRDVKLGSKDGIVKMQITKVGQAAHKMQKIPTAPKGRREINHVLPTCITSLRYDGQNDQLLTGDYQGISRVKLYATGKETLKVRAIRGSSLQQGGGEDEKIAAAAVANINKKKKMVTIKEEMKDKNVDQPKMKKKKEILDTEKEAERIIAEMNMANELNDDSTNNTISNKTTTTTRRSDINNSNDGNIEEELMQKSKTEEEAERIIREMGMMK